MDGGVVIGYLVTFLLGGAARLADRQLDGLLSGLWDRVRGRLRGSPALRDLTESPQDPSGQRRVRELVEDLAQRDPRWAAEIADLQHRLDRMGARQLFVNAPGSEIVVGVNHGVVVRNGTVVVNHHHGGGYGPDISTAAGWVKVLAVLGMALCVAGLGLFGYGVINHQPGFDDPDFGQPPPQLGLAAGLFFTGFVLAGIASVGTALQKRR
jgi:hypothetical protein